MKPGCKGKSRSTGSTGFRRIPEKVWEAPGQIQQGSGEGSGEALRKPWCKAKSGSTGPGEGC